MGGGAKRDESLIVEVDTANEGKDIDALDIEIPRLTRRYAREYKELDRLDPAALEPARLAIKPFTPEETREIVLKTMVRRRYAGERRTSRSSVPVCIHRRSRLYNGTA